MTVPYFVSANPANYYGGKELSHSLRKYYQTPTMSQILCLLMFIYQCTMLNLIQ